MSSIRAVTLHRDEVSRVLSFALFAVRRQKG
jgi:hypothetical protein